MSGAERWSCQQLLVGSSRLATCQLLLGSTPAEVTWQSQRCVRVEPPMADFAIVNVASVRDAVGVILRGNTGGSIVEQILRVQEAKAAGLIIINTSSEQFDPETVERELLACAPPPPIPSSTSS